MQEPTGGADQRFFEDVLEGESIPEREFGPLTIVDTVRWAGVQENSERLHWDREYAREQAGQRTFIASGAYRQALLVRCLTDWIGPGGRLRRLSVRHTYPTHEGDLMRFSGRIVRKSENAADPWLVCAVEGRNQEGSEILTGECTLVLPPRAN